ncbi:hypothetical protein ANN_27125 [Periplaneta americana]|uniref:Uncharacterized protein n=1 Tax=Periplaneta americana TaxID=6978 RepID=A0ABQ8RX56_PERAM|nr:hypothetical protein ANN_27125 [Periplaneta americana]
MAGLCEGGNEPPGSLKASNNVFFVEMTPVGVLHCFSRQPAASSGTVDQQVVSVSVGKAQSHFVSAFVAVSAKSVELEEGRSSLYSCNDPYVTPPKPYMK